MKASLARGSAGIRFIENNNWRVMLTTLVVALVYILSTNGLFINIAGFDLNPSKLFVISFLPVLILMIRGKVFYQEDLFFYMFIAFALIKALMFQDFKLATSMSNFIIPFLFYMVIRENLSRLNLKFLVAIILLWSALHAGFGILQFISGDHGLLVIEETNEFKLKYASNYAFNPFEELLLLPHGLYGYSSVLAISLIFPLFLAAGARGLLSLPLFAIPFGIMAVTVFLCFSRFEILSLLLLLASMFFVVKDGARIMFARLLSMVALLVAAIATYLTLTDDSIGSVSARLLTSDVLDAMIPDAASLILGVPTIFSFLDNFGFNIPHNMYFYLLIAYGLVAACLFSGYLWFKVLKYLKFYKRISRLPKGNCESFSIYIYVLLFLLFLLCLRAFDYYIIDGYENILLFFYCFIILDKIIDTYQHVEYRSIS
ncbi:MAG: hypothetical protein Q8J80_05450 [Gallionella sp.]|nr:hypothetical protein [Gallionella sp.]